MVTEHCILLLGPSGIGKTTVVKHLQNRVKDLHALSLDNITHKYARELGLISHRDDLNGLLTVLEQDRDRFFNFGLEALEQHVNVDDDKPILVDVGTGFLDSSNSLKWIHQHSSIALIANNVIAFDRFRKHRKVDVTYEQYMATQFHTSRIKAYNEAAVIIRTDLLDEVATVRRAALSVFGLCSDNVGSRLLEQWLSHKIY